MTLLAYDTPRARVPLLSRQSALRGYRYGMALLICIAAGAVYADALSMPQLELLIAMLGISIGAVTFAVCGLVLCWTGHGWVRRLVLLLLLPLLVLSVVRYHWPLRVTFKISSNQLSQLASSVAAGKATALPVRAGCFVIRSAEVRGGNSCLWTASGGHVGFVQCPVGTTAAQVNQWTEFPLNSTWHYVDLD